MLESKGFMSYVQTVSKSYQRTASLQRTADELGISYAKVRKILITSGEYRTEFSETVGTRRSAGKSIAEIASEFSTSTNRISAFLPYEKNLYSEPEPTTDAKKSRMYRKRVMTAQERFVNNDWNSIVKVNEVMGEKKMGEKVIRVEEMGEKDMAMETNIGNTRPIRAIHLHLELKDDHLGDEQKRTLRKYGGSSTGESICRDVLIPSDMLLHHLHYALQRAFGWQNSHLRHFELPEEIYNSLTGRTVKGWAGLVGVLFQPPSEHEHDIFWDDDYRNGSFKTWLRKKYTGPYSYGGRLETYEHAKRDIKGLLDQFPLLEVMESYMDAVKRSDDKGKGKARIESRILRQSPLIELTLEEMNNSLSLEGGTDSLLERLEVASVLACRDEALQVNEGVFPTTYSLDYHYDYGDDWIVRITREKDSGELLRDGHISESELMAAEAMTVAKHKPVCLHQDGAFVMDDVGGLHGFTKFLEDIHEGEDEEERLSLLEWAQSLGWSSRKVSNRMVY